MMSPVNGRGDSLRTTDALFLHGLPRSGAGAPYEPTTVGVPMLLVDRVAAHILLHKEEEQCHRTASGAAVPRNLAFLR